MSTLYYLSAEEYRKRINTKNSCIFLLLFIVMLTIFYAVLIVGYIDSILEKAWVRVLVISVALPFLILYYIVNISKLKELLHLKDLYIDENGISLPFSYLKRKYFITWDRIKKIDVFPYSSLIVIHTNFSFYKYPYFPLIPQNTISLKGIPEPSFVDAVRRATKNGVEIRYFYRE